MSIFGNIATKIGTGAVNAAINVIRAGTYAGLGMGSYLLGGATRHIGGATGKIIKSLGNNTFGIAGDIIKKAGQNLAYNLGKNKYSVAKAIHKGYRAVKHPYRVLGRQKGYYRTNKTFNVKPTVSTKVGKYITNVTAAMADVLQRQSNASTNLARAIAAEPKLPPKIGKIQNIIKFIKDSAIGVQNVFTKAAAKVTAQPTIKIGGKVFTPGSIKGAMQLPISKGSALKGMTASQMKRQLVKQPGKKLSPFKQWLHAAKLIDDISKTNKELLNISKKLPDIKKLSPAKAKIKFGPKNKEIIETKPIKRRITEEVIKIKEKSPTKVPTKVPTFGPPEKTIGTIIKLPIETKKPPKVYTYTTASGEKINTKSGYQKLYNKVSTVFDANKWDKLSGANKRSTIKELKHLKKDKKAYSRLADYVKKYQPKIAKKYKNLESNIKK